MCLRGSGYHIIIMKTTDSKIHFSHRRLGSWELTCRSFVYMYGFCKGFLCVWTHVPLHLYVFLELSLLFTFSYSELLVLFCLISFNDFTKSYQIAISSRQRKKTLTKIKKFLCHKGLRVQIQFIQTQLVLLPKHIEIPVLSHRGS